MKDHQNKDRWVDDIDARQRNVIFPDTLQNEARFWRNLGTTPSKTSTKVGLAILAIFVFGFAAVILVAVVQGGAIWSFILGMALFCGSIFGTIAWATRRSLRNIQKARRKR
jgi:hypothetical protein